MGKDSDHFFSILRVFSVGSHDRLSRFLTNKILRGKKWTKNSRFKTRDLRELESGECCQKIKNVKNDEKKLKIPFFRAQIKLSTVSEFSSSWLARRSDRRLELFFFIFFRATWELGVFRLNNLSIGSRKLESSPNWEFLRKWRLLQIY